VLQERLRRVLGGMTFAEAYQRSGARVWGWEGAGGRQRGSSLPVAAVGQKLSAATSATG
jgi:hypothetical protein